MHEKIGTFHFLHDAVELEALELLERLFLGFHAEDPQQMLPRDGQGQRLAAFDAGEALLPLRVVIPLGAPGNAASETMVHRRGARCVVPAQTQRHDADALTIKFGPRGEVIVGRAGVPLGLVVQRKVAKADGFAVSRPVEYQAGNAARGKSGNALEILDFLGDIEAVEEQHDRTFAAAAGNRVGVDDDARQARAFIRYFDVFDPRPRREAGRLSESIHAALVRGLACVGLGSDEPFAGVVIKRRPEKIGGSRQRIAFRGFLVADVFDPFRFARPFLKPG